VRKPAKKFNLAIPIILVLVIAVVAVALIAGGSEKPKTVKNHRPNTAYNSACGVYRNDKKVTINGATFRTERASNKDEYTRGLSGRPCILPDQAMLLAYTNP
jgi:hypothetical protein